MKAGAYGKLFALIWSLLPSLAWAVYYGVARETSQSACTTSGNATYTSAQAWQAGIAAATTGQTVLLRAGTYNASGNIVPTATNVTIRSYNCEAVTVNGQFVPTAAPDGLTLRGFTLNGGSTSTAFQTSANGLNNVSFINMTIRGGAIGGIRVRHTAADWLFEGLDLDNISSGASPSCSGAGLDIAGTTSGVSYTNFIIRNSKLRTTVCEDSLQFNLWAGTTIIEDNLFPGDNHPGNLADIKSPVGTGNTLIFRRNYTTDRSGAAGAAILIHGNAPLNNWAAGNTCRVEYNYFEDSGIILRQGEGNGENGGPCTFLGNVFNQLTAGIESLRIIFENAGNTIDGNTFFGGLFRIDTESSANIIRNNLWNGTTFSVAQADFSSCSNNNRSGGSVAITGCTSYNTDAPSFVNTATRDFNTPQTSYVDAGTARAPFNGTAADLGALEGPIATSCEIGTFAADVIVVDWTNNIGPPLSSATNASFSSRVATVARTINTTTVQNTNQTHHTLASAVTAGQAVDITCTTIGCVQDSIAIGGPELALNAKAKTFSQLSCTNNVDAAPAAWEVAQVAYRVTRENNVIAVNTPMSVPPGTAILVEFQTNCTGDDCPPFAQKMRYTLNGGDSTALSNTMTADNLRFFGNTDQSPYIPTEGTHTAGCLVDTAGVDVTGSVQRTSNAVPNLDLAINDCTVNAYAIIFDTDAVVGSTYAFCPANQDGTALNGGCDEPATIFISDFPGVPAAGRGQATGRTAATGRTQATGRVQVIQ